MSDIVFIFEQHRYEAWEWLHEIKLPKLKVQRKQETMQKRPHSFCTIRTSISRLSTLPILRTCFFESVPVLTQISPRLISISICFMPFPLLFDIYELPTKSSRVYLFFFFFFF